MNLNNYVDYSPAQLAADSSFRDWCLEAKHNDTFWSEFLARHPDKSRVVADAKLIVLGVSGYFSQGELSATEVEQRYRQTVQAARKRKYRLAMLKRRRTYATAAAVSLLLIASAVLFQLGYFGPAATGPFVYETDYGQQRQIALPDGSSVRLNANSKLTLSEDWDLAGTREVWLQGEAYFSVEKKLATRAKFIVHVRDLNVEVLGTQFNIDSRSEATEVVLDEGKIRLYTTVDTPEYTMSPGDIVSVIGAKVEFVPTPDADPIASSSWKDGYLLYKDTRLAEVLRDARYTFGYTLEIQDSSVLDQSITGALSAKDPEEFLSVLHDILPAVSFVKKDMHLVIGKRE